MELLISSPFVFIFCLREQDPLLYDNSRMICCSYNFNHCLVYALYKKDVVTWPGLLPVPEFNHWRCRCPANSGTANKAEEEIQKENA